MKNVVLLGSVALMSATCFVACGDDDDEPMNRQMTPGEGGSGGSGGSATATNAGEPNQSMAGSSSGAGAVEAPCSNSDGECIFRNDTFGDEQLWSDTLRLHEIVGSLPPTAALALGLKVDSEMV